MTTLLELREKIKLIYSRNEVFILPVVKFLLAFIVLNTINGRMGYMATLDRVVVVLVAALTCSFLPIGGIVFFATLFSLMHMYALSLEVALVGFCVYLLLYLLFLRFSPRDSLAVVLTPLLCIMGIPYIMPIAMGLIGTPMSAISVGCGVIIYYLILSVTGNANTISTMGSEEAAGKIRLVIDGIVGNKQMMVMVAAFAITIIVVYVIRRMSVDHSWTIAIITGVMADLAILLIGELLYSTGLSVMNVILGAVIAVLGGKVIEFFRFCVDYTRTEKVQFEDDEYYYYVKAVPKMTVAAPTKTVKKINTQRQGRTVTTEWTGGSSRGGASRGNTSRGHGRADYQDVYNERRSSGRSVTINSDNQAGRDADDDYEELF